MGVTQKMSLENAWKNWYACLNGDDPNSIFQQITIMIWDTSIFHIILAARQSQVKKNPQNPEINGALHSFIDRNFFHTQVSHIRRLTSTSHPLTGEWGVYSVGALLRDIRSCQTELTRERYFTLRKMPYDYGEMQEKEKDLYKNHSLEESSFIGPPDCDWEAVEEAHRIFDYLANVLPNKRSPNDRISDHVLEKLKDRLSGCRDFANYVDKFIAHLSTPESRAMQNYVSTPLTFKRLWEAQQAIFEVANFLSVILFDRTQMALALEFPTFFDYWQKPLFSNREIELVKTTLEDYRKETETWISDGFNAMLRYIKAD